MNTKKIIIILPVALMLVLTSCFKMDDYKDIKSEDVLNMQPSYDTVKADGIKAGNVSVILSDKAETKKTVLFITTLGTFENGNDSMYVDADERFTARAAVMSVRTGQAIVSAYAQNVRATRASIFSFVSVGPERISVSVDSFSIENDFRKEVVITASLSTENGGRPSVGHRVDFSVLQNNMPVGTFLNGRSYGFTDGDGKVRVRYAADKNTPAGLAVIRAETVSDLGNTITANTQIYIKN